MSAEPEGIRVRFVRLGKREQVEVTDEVRPGESVPQAVARLAHAEARAELKGVPLRVRITAPPVNLRSSGRYAYIEADMPKGGKFLPTRVGHGPVWVEGAP